MFADFLPHDWLFAQAACAIQHGGIGSIARALRQGCPLLIEPYGNDQFFNAMRVIELEVGAAMHPGKLTAEGIARVLAEKVLSPVYRRRAEAIGAHIRLESGLETACQHIDRIVVSMTITLNKKGIASCRTNISMTRYPAPAAMQPSPSRPQLILM